MKYEQEAVLRDGTSIAGPLLVAGIGGVAGAPHLDAAEMLDPLRGRALFDGFRGAPAVDRAALVDISLRIGALVELMPEIVELDSNPCVVLPDGAIAADGRLRLRAP